MIWMSEGETEKTPGKGQLPNKVPYNSLHKVPSLINSNTHMLMRQVIRLLHWQVNKLILKFVLSKIWSSSQSLSVTDMLKSIVKVLYMYINRWCAILWHKCFQDIFSICSTCSHTFLAKVGSVACWLGSLQLLESQSDLYSAIRNCLTTHSKPGLQLF